MFEKFGEMTLEELNSAAEGMKNEGDLDSLKLMAQENGLDPEDAEDYADGMAQELATPVMAALGRIKIQKAEMKPQDIMEDWVSYIEQQIVDKPEMAEGVMKKGKNLQGCIGALLKWAFGHQQQIDEDILKAAGVSNARVTLGMPGIGQAKKIITGYYAA